MSPNDITSLRMDIGGNVGQKVIVKGSLGRSKLFEKQAVIEKVYPSIFVVKYDENNRNVSYTYTDVLTKTVELKIFDGKEFNPIAIPQTQEKRRRKEYDIR
jgi:uncharacterized protein Veg